MLVHYILLKSDLASLKLEIGKLSIGKIKFTPVELRKLSDAVKMKLLKSLYIIN